MDPQLIPKLAHLLEHKISTVDLTCSIVKQKIRIKIINHFQLFVDHYCKRINEDWNFFKKNIHRQLNLELNKKPEEQNKKYIIALSSETRQNNIHLFQLGIGMPVISKMKEKIQGRKQKILSLANDYKNNHLLPSSTEITNMDDIDIEWKLEEKEKEIKLILTKSCFIYWIRS